jgi:hydrogenase-4 component B
MQFLSPVFLLLATTALFWMVAPFASLCCARNTNHRFWSVLVGAGSAALLAAALLAGRQLAATDRAAITFALPRPFFLLSIPIAFCIDPLAAWFLGVIAVVAACISPYLTGYLAHASRKVDMRIFWIALSALLMSMAAVVCAANALTFLAAWEAMSLTSFMLVATDHEPHSARHAALVYLGATRVGTALLVGGMLWTHALTGSWSFAAWHLSGTAALWPGLLILAGLGVKAGMWPFHLWLPVAHPAAPAPISALMSGVMVKVAIAVMIRLFLVSPAFDVSLFGYLILALGAISALWGVLFALLQHDLKRLLAYHTVENIGLILMGLGLAIIARRLDLPIVAEIALAAALFHVLNHALFKSLLFLGAGSVDVAAGTRDIDQLGGLGKRMPWTYGFFVLGAAAICGLPPLNGFASEWLLYQSLVHMAHAAAIPLLTFSCLLLVGWIGLVGVLALACFTKAIGVVFQGRPRSSATERAHDVDFGMRLAQALLAGGCVLLGLFAPVVLSVLQAIAGPVGEAAVHPSPSAIAAHLNVAQASLPATLRPPGSGAYILASAWTLPIGAVVAVLIVTVGAGLFWMNRADAFRPVRRYSTWDCGFGELSARAQVSGASFVQPIARMFRVVFLYVENLRVEGGDHRLFPDEVTAVATTESVLEMRVYRPAARWFQRLADVVLRLHDGSIHGYLMTMVVTLIVLLLIGGYMR